MFSSGPAHNRSSNAREVNNLLHTLRGEHFRHSQNLLRSRTHVSSSVARNVHSTLPAGVISLNYLAPAITSDKEDLTSSAYKNCPGPEAPKSWILTSQEAAVEDTPAWRAAAASLVLPDPPAIPPLTNLCLRLLATLPTQDFIEGIVPYLYPHLRRDLIRHAAIHSPLPSPKLFALCAPLGHVDTELIVVGPQAELSDDYFLRANSVVITPGNNFNEQVDDTSWDTDHDTGGEPLHTLLLMSTRLATSTLLSLPPSITHLALVHIPAPVPLHRLPGTCPLIVVLDFSYNSWLSPQSQNAQDVLGRIEWRRWDHLRVLGLRGCLVSDVLLKKLNRGRWDDVDVIQ